MKLVMTMMVRDEEDIIKQNIDYHLAKGIDHFIVTNHKSTDGTLDILKEYERFGIVTIKTQEINGWYQADAATKMAIEAYNVHKADWVFHGDADEFFVSPINYKELLNDIPPNIGNIKSFRYPMQYISGKGLFYERMCFKSYKWELWKIASRGSNKITVDIGAHNVYFEDSNLITVNFSNDIFYNMHFAIRSKTQLIKKVIIAYKSFLDMNPPAPAGCGAHIKELYQKIVDGSFDEHFNKTYVMPMNDIQKALINKELTYDSSVKDILVSKDTSINSKYFI